MPRNNRWIGVAVALIVGFANLLYAQNAPTRATNSDALLEVLQTLEAKGVLSQQEYDALKKRVEQSNQESAQKAAPPAKTVSAQQEGTPGQETAQKIVTFMDSGVGIHAGQFDITISGEINGFYVHDRVDNSSRAKQACVLCLASTNATDSSSIRNGLLPGDLSFKISTRERGWDVAIFFGIYPGIQSLETGNLVAGTFGGLNLAKGNPTGFGVAGVDFRQQFVTFGRPHLGTFKIGRDLGYFGQEAVLNDFTLLGAGTTNGNGGGNNGPGSTTLGGIGLGEIYADFMPQISYMTPSVRGFQAAGAILAPVQDVISTTLGLTQYSAPLTGDGQPQFQGKVTYNVPIKGRVKAKFWTNFLTQSLEADLSDHNNDSALTIPVGHRVRAWGLDYGTKLSLGAADLVAYGYNGSGIGTEGLMFFSTSPTGHTRNSQGYYAQGTYTFAKKLTLGVRYGQSNLSLAGPYGNNGETLASSSQITRNNQSEVAQLRYALTKWVNLVSEYTHTRSVGQARVVTTSDAIALGTIAFF